ncbi:MAG TPA: hypothetical protein VFM10_02615 [Terriglobales bacterium]|nr:hypothetical protein [Terriglobales bacterium]
MEQNTTRAAEFYRGTAGRSACVDITAIGGGHRTIIASFPVANKREARRLAADFGAQCWNF